MIVEEQERIAICDASVSTCIERIQFYRVGEHPAGQLVVRFRVPLHKLPTAKIKSVRFDIVCRRLRDDFFSCGSSFTFSCSTIAWVISS